MSTTTEVKEREWLTRAHEARAILDGRQSQFRRVVKLLPGNHADKAGCARRDEQKGWLQYVAAGMWIPFPVCPFGKPGDRLWMREAFGLIEGVEQCPWPGMPHRMVAAYEYHGAPITTCLVWRASFDRAGAPKWKASIHMPRWASRITLEVIAVRVERVQEISADDAELEGIEMHDYVTPQDEVANFYKCGDFTATHPVLVFKQLWNSINAKRGFGWDVNPFAWCVSFERVTP